MCLRNSVIFSIIAAFAVESVAHADAVADYLERHGLTRLLAVHLEQRLGHLTGDHRGAMLERLAKLYADLLEEEVDAAKRSDLEQRSRRILEQAPQSGSEELRLALLRASYRTAERIAESHRLRMATADELETARRVLADITPQLGALRQRVRENLDAVERRRSRAFGSESASINEGADRVRNLLSQCTFVNAWALYYQAWLTNQREAALAAEPLFAELLMTESSHPNPGEVSEDLRGNEAVARSILGMALCKSLTASNATAVAWVELLQHAGTFAPLRKEAAAWRAAIELEHGEFQRVMETLEQHRLDGFEIPPAWLRLAAVYSLEAEGTRGANALAQLALTELATQGELPQVLDLATRYGTRALGQSGFPFRYVEGVIAYQQARQAHGSDEPTAVPEIAAQYQKAVELLARALDEGDVGKHAAAASACRRLRAWCLYFQRRFMDAQLAFDEAAHQSSGTDAADAAWMAIVSLDKLMESEASAEAQARLAELSDRFVRMHGDDSRAATLRLKRTINSGEISPSIVAELLAIGPDTPVYDSAQRRAADVLYQLFRQAAPEDRSNLAMQFLSVSLPQVTDRGAISAGADNQWLVTRCRQVLEVALAEGIERSSPARAALDMVEVLDREYAVDLAAHRDEFDCRRAQERLLADDLQSASTLADGLWQRSPNSIWARLAVRAVFKHAHRVWKNPATDRQAKDTAVELVVRHGGRVLHEFKDDPDALNQTGAIGYHSAVAEASMEVWEQTGDQERGRAARFLFERLLSARPGNAVFLRSAAILNERLGDSARALECWRRLVAGATAGSLSWYEAKFHLIQMLAKVDPQRAREVMDQHKLLNPEFGPEPWGAMLKGLDEQIPMLQDTSTP